ncbi:MAG: DoxX family protein [bacterium]
MGTAINLSAGVAGVSTRKSIARYLPVVGRVVMGLPLFIFGLNAFLNFIPQPTTPMADGAAAFLGALAKSGYMLQLIGGTQLIVGALLLSGRFVPLALALFAPFIVNSIAFHIVLEPTGLPFATVFLIIELGLVRSYWHAYRPMLASRTPRGAR